MSTPNRTYHIEDLDLGKFEVQSRTRRINRRHLPKVAEPAVRAHAKAEPEFEPTESSCNIQLLQSPPIPTYAIATCFFMRLHLHVDISSWLTVVLGAKALSLGIRLTIICIFCTNTGSHMRKSGTDSSSSSSSSSVSRVQVFFSLSDLNPLCGAIPRKIWGCPRGFRLAILLYPECCLAPEGLLLDCLIEDPRTKLSPGP